MHRVDKEVRFLGAEYAEAVDQLQSAVSTVAHHVDRFVQQGRMSASVRPTALGSRSPVGQTIGVITTSGVSGWPSRTVCRNPVTAGTNERAENVQWR
ncbi:hypothetical protein AB0878_47000 [Amycolatopsis sp. NPDC047767]|uniref:hypothetical protein n=1 Tax=Amycolatopsis sp. NPDC047767 TaxID=3156765 RepID=UPI003455D268